MNHSAQPQLRADVSATLMLGALLLATGCTDGAREGGRVGSASSANSAGEAQASASAPSATTTVVYEVIGMHCNGCADAIVAEVSEVKGVKGVQCTFESKRAIIELADPAAATEAARAITKMGYTIAPAEPSSK